MTRRKAPIAICSTTALFALLTGCGEAGAPGADQEARQDLWTRPPSSPSQPASSDPAPPPAPTRPAPPSAADNELGLPHDVIVRLGQAADVFGYGLGPGTNLDYEQATDFAYAVSLTCDAWRSGEMTLQDSVDEDVMSGAPVSDARAFNRFLRDDFCPAYHRAGN